MIYRLYSVIIHSGNLEGGHYYAYCKEGEEWMEFNDSTVQSVTLN